MAFGFLKRKKKEEPQKKTEKPLVEKKDKEEEQVPSKPPVAKKKGKTMPSLPNVLCNPHVTEKAAMLGEKGQYVFSVDPNATKDSIKQSVEALYGVSVQSVRLQKKPSRKVRVGRKMGVKPGLKKAIVQLKGEERMEVISR